MTATWHQKPGAAPTLLTWLERQVDQRGDKVALRYKRSGIWHQRSWRDIHEEVTGLAAGLEHRGFSRGKLLVVLSTPRPEALLISLAAQYLGGTAALLDPNDDIAAQHQVLTELEAEFVFAEGRHEVERVLAAQNPATLIYADARGLRAIQQTAQAAHRAQGLPSAYGDLLDKAFAPVLHSHAQADGDAFTVYRRDDQGGLNVLVLTHAELLANGQFLLGQESLGADEDAFAARAFAASAQARYLLAPWLLAGFRLNFPESLETRDNDRREIGPTLVLGTRATYQRVEQSVRERLPQAGSVLRRLVDWALDSSGAGGRSRFGDWFVRRPLRDVIGFTRTRSPLIVGEPLPEASQRFFAALGIEVRAWPEPTGWQPYPAQVASQATTLTLLRSSTAAFDQGIGLEPA